MVVRKRGNPRIATSRPRVPGGNAELMGAQFSQDLAGQCMSGEMGWWTETRLSLTLPEMQNQTGKKENSLTELSIPRDQANGRLQEGGNHQKWRWTPMKTTWNGRTYGTATGPSVFSFLNKIDYWFLMKFKARITLNCENIQNKKLPRRKWSFPNLIPTVSIRCGIIWDCTLVWWFCQDKFINMQLCAQKYNYFKLCIYCQCSL